MWRCTVISAEGPAQDGGAEDGAWQTTEDILAVECAIHGLWIALMAVALPSLVYFHFSIWPGREVLVALLDVDATHVPVDHD